MSQFVSDIQANSTAPHKETIVHTNICTFLSLSCGMLIKLYVTITRIAKSPPKMIISHSNAFKRMTFIISHT